VEQTNQLDKHISTKFLLKFALPTIISMTFTGLYSVIDGFFVANFISTDALSAVNLMMPIVFFSIAVGMMLGTGGIAVIARKLGQKREQEARENLSLIMLLAFIVSVIISAVAFLYIEPMIYLLGADKALYALCYDYAVVVLAILPLTIFSVITQNAFIAAGKAHLSLALAVLGGVINIILDYVLIVPFDMGITGAALATALGYAIPAVIGALYFACNRKGILYLVKPKFDGKALWQSCTNGASEMVNSLSVAITTLLFNLAMMSMLGSDGVAALSIALYLMSIMSSVFMGYSVGIAPLISYNYGKNETQRLKKIFQSSMAILIISSVAVFALSIAFAQPLVRIFTHHTSSVYALAVGGCRLFATGFLFMGVNIFASSMFTALSNGLVSAVLAMCRSIIFTISAILLLPHFLGVNGIWLAIPVAEFLGLLMAVFYFVKMKTRYHY